MLPCPYDRGAQRIAPGGNRRARPDAVNGTLSLDDVRVLPLLRSAAVVQPLRFPAKVRDYFEAMMRRIGHRPLPAI